MSRENYNYLFSIYYTNYEKKAETVLVNNTISLHAYRTKNHFSLPVIADKKEQKRWKSISLHGRKCRVVQPVD